MSQRPRSGSATREAHPMEIDEGTRGLEQSRHHLLHQRATYNAPADDLANDIRGGSDLETKLNSIFIGLGVQAPSRRLLKGLTAFVLAERDNVITTTE